MGLEHNFLYISPDKYSDDIWKTIHYNPLRLENELVSELDYVDIHDDLLRYFHDYFVWIKLYNPCKKEYVNGFCYYGPTTIYGDALFQIKNILDGLLTIFSNAPNMVELKGNFMTDENGNEYYDKIYIEKNKITRIQAASATKT
jgi:hypothetical protein